MYPEYTFDLVTGWQPLLPGLIRPQDTTADLRTLLLDAGYLILAREWDGRSGVGAFRVWAYDAPPDDWPCYAIEILQIDAESVIWITTLPALWEWLRLYGALEPQNFWTPSLPGADEEAPDVCPQCGVALEQDGTPVRQGTDEVSEDEASQPTPRRS